MKELSRFSRTAIAFAVVLGLAGTVNAGQQVAASSTAVQTVSLQTVVSDGAKPLKEKVSYSVYRLEPAHLSGHVGEFSGAPAVLQLSNGRYRVVTAYRDTTVHEDIVVEQGTTKHVVNLNAGRVSMRVIPSVGKKAIRKNVSWEIWSYGKDSKGNRHLITSSRKAEPEFLLQGGYYLAKALVSGKEVRHTIEVTEGAAFQYTMTLN